MKKHKNFIIYTLIFVIVMILAVVGYNYLSKNYVPEELKSEEKTDSMQSGATTLKKATDFSVLNNNRRKGELI